MASPDTVVLLIVDHHAVIWGQDPRGPLRTPQNTVASNV